MVCGPSNVSEPIQLTFLRAVPRSSQSYRDERESIRLLPFYEAFSQLCATASNVRSFAGHLCSAHHCSKSRP